MTAFLQFLVMVGSELYDLFAHYEAGKPDDAKAQELAMRLARKVSDEIAKKDIAGP